MKKIYIPYMGGKQKIVESLMNKMIEENPKAKYFVDLFGGGGSLSFYAVQHHRFKQVLYNELNTGVVELIKYIIQNGITDKFYEWVDRETFNKHKDDNDWYGGYLKTCWSFGNSQIGYLYGKEIEEPKKHLHLFIVNKNNESKEYLEEHLNIKIPDNIFKGIDNIQARRLKITSLLRSSKLQDEISSINLERLEKLYNLQNMQKLNNISGIESINNKDKLIISNKSYEEVDIPFPPDETIVYMDIPYKDTTKYQHGIDYDEVDEYIKESPYKIYLSEYNHDWLELALELDHISTFSPVSNSTKTIERLYRNFKYTPPLLFS